MARNIFITGGAGFIGINSAEKFIKNGWKVVIFDNLSRKGSVANLKYLEEKYKKSFGFIQGDVRDEKFVATHLRNCDVVLHLAAQVAVTTSVQDPREDFSVNALGTLNVLEAVRKLSEKPLVIYASTNKVYGRMEEIKIVEGPKRYSYADFPLGISEQNTLDFHSPYGCSKGCADQYIHDYSRIYDLPTVVFRQSCIYGPHQFGVEDQGWVAWFIIATALNKPITIYGNGKQVRDVLCVDDLTDLYFTAAQNPQKVRGRVYNIGGGPKYTLSLIEFIEHIEKSFNKRLQLRYTDWRPGDQPVYISDIRTAYHDIGWEPKIAPQEGVEMLTQWVAQNKHLFTQ